MPAEARRPERPKTLAVIETHPVQYRAPVYRALHERFQIPITVIYGSDFSVSGYYDKEFKSEFAWDTDLVSGYPHIFLSKTAEGGGRTYATVSARGMYRSLRKLNPAAILLVGYSPRFHQWGCLHAWTSGRAVLFRGETADRAQTGGAVTLGLRARLLRSFYRRCQRLIYIGQRSREHFLSYGCADDKLAFSPYCVDVSPFEVDEEARLRLRGPARDSLGISEGDTVLLFSGKLSERKGPDLLVQAVSEMPAEKRERTLVVFLGNGEMLPQLEQTAARSQVRIRCLGFQNQKSISPWFHAADLLVLPSRRLETWGLVVNEALHHGLPCVVSDAVGCSPDLISAGATGEVFETGSASALGAALNRAWALVGRPEIRESCRVRIAAYSVDKAAEGIARAYEAAIA
ncbi:MAG: glycosyltransferase family 4 protein [Acidobacteriota bacterium]|nr:glycosyltransferase family 4 protein [Acidobacteriota bacterium]